MSNTKVTIVLPVYNVARFLHQCLDSLLAQTLPNLKIICVNDGSTDNSLEILEEYASKHPNITVLSQENQGAGVARNTGLAQVTSDYVAFLDPDDFVTPTMYQSLYEKAVSLDAEMVLCGAENFNHTTQCFYVAPLYEMYAEDIPEGLFSHEQIGKRSLGVFHSNPCNRLISVAYLKRINLTFQEIFRHDGFFFTHTSFLSSSKLAFVLDRCYKYRTHIPGSSSATNHRYPLDKYKAHLKIQETLNLLQVSQETRFFYYANSIIDTLDLIEKSSSLDVFQLLFHHLKEHGEKDFEGTKLPDDFMPKKWKLKYEKVLSHTCEDYIYDLYSQEKWEKEALLSLQALRVSQDSLCFFGAGGCGRFILKQFQEFNLKPPVAIIDNLKSGTVFQGIEVLSLEECLKKYPKCTVLITVISAETEVKQQLSSLIPDESVYSLYQSPWSVLEA